MHPKFAERLAKVVQAKKKAHGIPAVSRWWEERFGHLPNEQWAQVMEVLKSKR